MNNNKSTDRPELLIEESLPVRTIGIESEREGKGKFPPLNRLHVWWARRPLIAARTAVLASVIGSEQMNMEELVERMGISGNTVEKYQAREAGQKPDDMLVYEWYGYRRPFTQDINDEDFDTIQKAAKETWDGELPTVLDPTAGGGAIPFESRRYGFPTIANELHEVPWVLLKSVLEHASLDTDLSDELQKYGEKINKIAKSNLSEYYPSGSGGERPVNFMWSHTVTCPDCRLELPLAPNWWLDKKSSKKGTAVRPSVDGDAVEFEIVKVTPSKEQAKNNEDLVTKEEYNPSDGTVSWGKGECLKCGVTIEGDEIKEQAQSGEFGFQLYGVEYKNENTDERGIFRSPTETDRQFAQKAAEAVESNPELNMLLSEDIPEGHKTDEARRYGMFEWRDAFLPRQLLAHYELWQAFEEVKPEIQSNFTENEAKTILTFLSIAADKSIDYNSRFSSWEPSTPKVAHSFDRHDFAFKWSFAEPVLVDESHGYQWFLNDVIEVYDELTDYLDQVDYSTPLRIYNEDARNLDEISDGEVQAVVMDPPYYDNVMYGELADYFHVWMKRYLNDVYPQVFNNGNLTDKTREAVANPSQFDEVAGEEASESELAKDDYERKMTQIFDEVSRVLEEDGIFTLMFTHKKTEAWDTLAKALIEAGFEIHASHPISTESQRSLHQSGKNAAQSTIFLTARKRDTDDSSVSLWDEIKDETRDAAFEKAKSLDNREVEFSNVDMMLSAFGPTLEVFTKNQPVEDAEGNPVEPQTALDEAREAVREYLIDRYLNEGVKGVDPKTEWYILAWTMFEAERFPYDEGRLLAVGIGEDVDNLKTNDRMWRKRSGDILLRTHDERVQDINKEESNRSSRKPVNPEAVTFSTALDKVHAAMHVYDVQGEGNAWSWMETRNCANDPEFKATLEAILRVLPRGHDDWELARNLVAGDTGDLLELDLDASIFRTDEETEDKQGKITDDYTSD